jgi:hypothetical protein
MFFCDILSHFSLVSSYILSPISMITGSNVHGLTYLHLHLYPCMENWTACCSFSYLVNFMLMIAELAQLDSIAFCSVIYSFHSKFP